MSAYEVKADKLPCDHCGASGKYLIVGPEGSVGKYDPETAQSLCSILNAAYEQGHAAGHKELSPEAREILREDYRRELRKDAEMPETIEVLRPAGLLGAYQIMPVCKIERVRYGQTKLLRIIVA